ncbi:MAG TPA: hypothetical protein VFJ22_19120 [Dermatophilaceae bacterium]|nr:hypothetical protein [Dermatophilaceae bacterium]
MRRTALAVAVVDLAAVTSLVVFFAVGGPFGAANDVLNAAMGVLSALLAWQHHGAAARGRTGLSAVGAAGLGGVVMAVGSFLVISGITGWYLAGLVSSVGAAAIGAWLVTANQAVAVATDRPPGATVPGSSRLRQAAGAVMLLGVLCLPGVLSGIDDQALAPWYVVVGQLGWLGTYVLYPAWCLRLAACLRAGAPGPGAMLSPR